MPADVDYAISICSLPGLFKAGIKPIPNKSYIESFNDRSGDIVTDKLKVGLCWAGNADHSNDYRRSIHLGKLAPLFALDNVQLFSLQKSVESRVWSGKPIELNNMPFGSMIDLSSRLNDFSDTADFVEQMDVVVTVDTSVAHLAAAMGKPTWVLIDKINDWRWGESGETSEWYPSMRLFRQDKLFEWEPVINRVVKELASYQKPQLGQTQSPACDKTGLSKRRSRKRPR